mgnify:CR=1 FL=1
MTTPVVPRIPRRLYLTIVAGAVIMSVAMGIRQSFGLVLGPGAVEWGLSLSTLALAIALHNLFWGLAQPVAGAMADRYGATPVVVVGAVALAAGLALTALLPGLWAAMLGTGVLVGIVFGSLGSAAGLLGLPTLIAPLKLTGAAADYCIEFPTPLAALLALQITQSACSPVPCSYTHLLAH